MACWLMAAEESRPGLPARQLHALRTVRLRLELNLTALAEHLGVGLPTASRLCDRLEAAGLLERTVQPRNRREVQLLVTAYALREVSRTTSRRVPMSTVRSVVQSLRCSAEASGRSATSRIAAESRRELELFLSRRGSAFLADLRSRREAALEGVLELMSAVQRTALLRGLEAFCSAAAEQIHDSDAADARTA